MTNMHPVSSFENIEIFDKKHSTSAIDIYPIRKPINFSPFTIH
jgi:hypothetical protein